VRLREATSGNIFRAHRNKPKKGGNAGFETPSRRQL
jgi:hypothetical protein